MQIHKILTRVFVNSTELESSIQLFSGSEDRPRQFTERKVTLLVNSIDEFFEFLTTHDSTILEYPKSVPTGKNMRVRHPDGLIAEYVQHISISKTK